MPLKLPLWLLLAACLTACAQETISRASLTGRVTDPTGAMLPHASVTARNSSTGH